MKIEERGWGTHGIVNVSLQNLIFVEAELETS
jgi:hypothetical protein